MSDQIREKVQALIEQEDLIGAVQHYANAAGVGHHAARQYVGKLATELSSGKATARKAKAAPVATVTARPSFVREFAVPEVVERVQSLVLENIATASEKAEKCTTSVFDIVRNIDRIEGQYATGDLVPALKDFIEKANVDHPSISLINSGTLMPDGKVYKRVVEALELGKLMKSNKMAEMPEAIRGWFNRNHKKILRILTSVPPRLLKDNDKRKAARTKEVKPLKMSALMERGRQHSWDALQPNFVPFVRLGPGMGDEIKYMAKMKNRMGDLHMSALSRSLDATVKQIEEAVSDKYCGFVRVKTTEVAMMLAKSMGFNWIPGTAGGRLLGDPNYFKFAFWDNGDPIDPAKPYKTAEGTVVSFTPRLYPLSAFQAFCPQRVTKIIESIEAHSDTCGYPIFDDYWVVMPSVSVAASNRRSSTEFWHEGKQYNYGSEAAYNQVLDAYLVETGQVFPVVVGDHSTLKKAYFICYWA